MKIGPMFKWFGSKWQSAKRYPRPEHDIIIEPYAGGAGYSLNHCQHRVHIWDADPHVSALWRWIIEEALPDDILSIPIGIPVGVDIRDVGLSRGQALLLKHWQRTNNVGDCWTISPWGHLPGQWTTNTRARVAEEFQAIRHWELYDFGAVDWSLFQAGTWFIDPPYQYNYQYRPSLGKFNHAALAERIVRIDRSALVIACEARGKTGELPGYLPFLATHSSVTSRRKPSQSHHSKELTFIRLPH